MGIHPYVSEFSQVFKSSAQAKANLTTATHIKQCYTNTISVSTYTFLLLRN